MRRELEAARRGMRAEDEQRTTHNDSGDFVAIAGGSGGHVGSAGAPRTNIMAVADLLSNFSGKPDDYEVWEKQMKLLKTMYKLEDDTAKILIGMRLKGRALKWLHFRPEYIAMTFDSLLNELKAMFHRRQSKVLMRKRFEERTWKKSETFHEYFHEKIIMGNRVPIDDDEMLEYIVDSILDEALQNQARIQRFTTTDGLLEAFEKVTLWDLGVFAKYDKRSGEQTKNEQKKNGEDGSTKKSSVKAVRCYNCGDRDHVSVNCPTKEQGAKCFKCGERGHTRIAARCSGKSKTNTESCMVSGVLRRKYFKNILFNNRAMEALIDLGSDFSLIRVDEYIKLGSPKLRFNQLRFDGVGSNNNVTLGEFQIVIDGYSYPICVQVISDTMLRHQLLIETNFLNMVDVNFTSGEITIRPLSKSTQSAAEWDDAGVAKGDVPEIFKIDVIDERACDVNVSHIVNVDQRMIVQNSVNSYKPKKIRESDVIMKLVLRDEEPVYQSAKRLSVSEKCVIDAQIDQWLADGII